MEIDRHMNMARITLAQPVATWGMTAVIGAFPHIVVATYPAVIIIAGRVSHAHVIAVILEARLISFVTNHGFTARGTRSIVSTWVPSVLFLNDHAQLPMSTSTALASGLEASRVLFTD